MQPAATHTSEPVNQPALTERERVMLMVMPHNAKYVLEILPEAEPGMAAAYTQENPHADYHATTLAKGWADVEKGSVDCLVVHDLASIQEDPAAWLADLKPLLAPGGVVVAILENPLYWQRLQQLLTGKWPYKTRDGHEWRPIDMMRQHITKAGLQLVGSYPLNEKLSEPLEKKKQAILETIPALMEHLGVVAGNTVPQLRAEAFVLRMIPAEKKFNTLFIQTLMLKPVGACNDVRIIEPNTFVASIPGVFTQNTVGGVAKQASAAFERRVFIYQRPILRYSNLEILRWAVKENFLLVTEFDDHPERWSDIETNRYLNYRGVHAVQTSTAPLADFLRQFNPNIRIFPNQLAKLPPERDYTAGGPVKLFFGALNRVEDWGPLMPALNRVLKRFGADVHVRVVYDHEFFAALETPHKDFTGLCEYPHYRAIMGECHISLLPLADTNFNRMKSDLKFIESAGMGVVSLASPVVYAETLRDDETGVLFHTPEAFETKLAELIANPERRIAIAKRGYAYIRNERLQCLHYESRYAWYNELIDQLPALNAQLKERVPELFEAP